MPRRREFTVTEVLKELERQCAAAESRAAWCRQYGVSEAYLSGVLSGRQDPGPAILTALGFRKLPPAGARYQKI